MLMAGMESREGLHERIVHAREGVFIATAFVLQGSRNNQ